MNTTELKIGDKFLMDGTRARNLLYRVVGFTSMSGIPCARCLRCKKDTGTMFCKEQWIALSTIEKFASPASKPLIEIL